MWTSIRREPLVHFIILSALLFAVNAFWSSNAREEIRIDRATTDLLIQHRSDMLLRPATKDEQDQVIATYVDDEILFREAQKRGLVSNGRVRRLLVSNMRYFLASDLPKPTDQDLRVFYEENRQRFEQPPSITIDHVFFAETDKVPEGLLDQLAGGADHENIGDFDLNFGPRLSNVDRGLLVGLLGPDAARSVLSIDDSEWHGPILSTKGAHFVRILEHRLASLPDFEQSKPWLETEWRRARQREALDRELAGMRRNYDIVIDPREAPKND